MDLKDRLTAQGIRDLNYYGPRKARVAAGALEAAAETLVEASVIASETAVPVAVTE